MNEENKQILMAYIQSIQKRIELVEKESKKLQTNEVQTIMALQINTLKHIESLSLTLWKIFVVNGEDK